MGLLFALQLVAHIDIYDTKVSASAQFYMENFKDFVDFKSLEPDNILGQIEEGLTMQSLFKSSSDDAKKEFNVLLEQKGHDSTNIFYNLQAFLFAGGIALVFILIMLAIGCVCKKQKDKITDYLKGLKANFIWNGIINSVSLSYVLSNVSNHNTVAVILQSTTSIGLADITTCILSISFLALYPLICLCVLFKNRKRLTD